MTKGKLVGVLAGVAVLAWAGPSLGWSLFPPSPKVGRPAPPFTATLFSGGKVSLADYRGQVLIVNVWATWCGPCRRELPFLEQVYRLTQKNGLRILAVTAESSVPDRQLQPLAQALSFPLAHEVRGPYGDLDAVPTNYVIDRAGVVRYAQAGALDLDTFNRVVIPLINEAAPPLPDPAGPAVAPAKSLP